MSVIRAGQLFLLFLGVLVSSGCDSTPTLMPTPNLYAHPEWNAFADVPKQLQSNKAPVLYLTDRNPLPADQNNSITYGWKRSFSTAWGTADLQIGDASLTWDQLLQASRTQDRSSPLKLSVVNTREMGRFAPTPSQLIISAEQMQQTASPNTSAPADKEVESQFLAELSARLSQTSRKEVYLFIHGFDNSFNDSIMTVGELWHFLGREGVPVAYSWPAGMGLLRAYVYTNQSAEFTVFHFKRALKLIASCPAVEKIHIIAHSRGTAVTTDGLRDLVIAARHSREELKKLKIGRVILAAADLDIDVVIERDATERLAAACERLTIYIFKEDKALAVSSKLAGGVSRLGDMSSHILSADDILELQREKYLQIVDATITKPGPFGHSYFYANSDVSSDLVLFMRYGLPVGGPDGRPMKQDLDTGYWVLPDGYPGSLDSDWFRSLGKLAGSKL